MSQDADTAAQAQTASAQISADATKNAAELSSNAQITASGAQAGATLGAAATAAQANVEVATIDAKNRIEVTKLTDQNNIDVANINAGTQRYVADRNRDTPVEVAHIDAENRLAVQELQNEGQANVATIDAVNRLEVTDKTTTANLNQTATESQARITAAQIDADAQHYSADQQLAGVQAREAGENTRLATKLNYVESKFELAYTLAQQGLQFLTDGGLGTPGLLDLSSAPYVSTRGVFTPAQVQQQVNAAYARNDARTQSQIRQAQGDLAGRGFSSNSPILDALKVGYLGQNLKANNDAATSLRLQAATANADQITKGQTLAVSVWQAKQQVALDSEKNQITRQVGLLSAVAQMVGGVS